MKTETTTLAQKTLEDAKLLIQAMDEAGYVYDRAGLVKDLQTLKMMHAEKHEPNVVKQIETIITHIEGYEHAFHDFLKNTEHMLHTQGSKDEMDFLVQDIAHPEEKNGTIQWYVLMQYLQIACFFALIVLGTKLIVFGGVMGMRWNMIVFTCVGFIVFGVGSLTKALATISR